MAHWLGWTLGEVITAWAGDTLWIGFRCSVCRRVDGAHRSYDRRTVADPISGVLGAGNSCARRSVSLTRKLVHSVMIHRIQHWLGWNFGEIVSAWAGDTLWVGFRCTVCRRVDGAHRSYTHREVADPISGVLGAALRPPDEAFH